jgi:Domain of unknown function (DUF4157)
MRAQATAVAERAPITSISAGRAPLLQRKCACGGSAGFSGECEECKKAKLQRKSDAADKPRLAESVAPPIVYEVLRSPGQPLDAETRAFFEPRFGHDFSQVRIHNEANAITSSRAVNALAYTVGPHIVFGETSYRPQTGAGRKLLAHELAHTIQQSAVGAHDARLVEIQDSTNPLEREAEVAASSVMHGDKTAPVGKNLSPMVQRIPLHGGTLPDNGEIGLEGEDPSLSEHDRGSTLPHRQATELVRCIDFFGKGTTPENCIPNRPLTWADFTGTPPRRHSHVANTRPDIRSLSFSPPGGFCRHEVLGEPLEVRHKFQAFLDGGRSWVVPATANANDPAQNGCDQKISACESFFDAEATAGRTGGTQSLATPGGCPAAVPFPATTVAHSRDQCQSALMPACIAREVAESQRVLHHEQLHFDIGCVLANKANALLPGHPDPEALLQGARAQLQPLHDRYDRETRHGCLDGPQATWDTDVGNGLPTITVQAAQRRPARRRRRARR